MAENKSAYFTRFYSLLQVPKVGGYSAWYGIKKACLNDTTGQRCQ
jgi:hypothetical protein